jgi:hypothetical protein
MIRYVRYTSTNGAKMSASACGHCTTAPMPCRQFSNRPPVSTCVYVWRLVMQHSGACMRPGGRIIAADGNPSRKEGHGGACLRSARGHSPAAPASITSRSESRHARRVAEDFAVIFRSVKCSIRLRPTLGKGMIQNAEQRWNCAVVDCISVDCRCCAAAPNLLTGFEYRDSETVAH